MCAQAEPSEDGICSFWKLNAWQDLYLTRGKLRDWPDLNLSRCLAWVCLGWASVPTEALGRGCPGQGAGPRAMPMQEARAAGRVPCQLRRVSHLFQRLWTPTPENRCRGPSPPKKRVGLSAQGYMPRAVTQDYVGRAQWRTPHLDPEGLDAVRRSRSRRETELMELCPRLLAACGTREQW